jgi:LuxR family transcriptional regulator of csgAB operon
MKPAFITVSNNKPNSELVSYLLEKEFDTKCTCIEILSKIESQDDSGPGRCAPRSVCLIDCQGLNTAEIEQVLDSGGCLRGGLNCPELVLFNVEGHLKIKALVKRCKIKGVFFRSDSPEIMCKGIRAIRKGRPWLPCKIFSEYTLVCPPANSVPREAKALSNRQRIILKLIAEGDSNQQIADKLSISIHTVKTHIYHIYRKFNVTNRIQASLFAYSTANNGESSA